MFVGRKRQTNETCPFYTVSNAFLSAIVCRHSLNSIYQKLIIVRTERKKRNWEREREGEKVRASAREKERECLLRGTRVRYIWVDQD